MKIMDLRISAAVVLSLVLAGCGSTGADMNSTITLKVANERLDAYISRTMQNFPGNVTFEEQLTYRDATCHDPETGEGEGKKQAERSYFINGTDTAKIKDYFDTVRNWWTKNNFRILDNEDRYKFLWVEDNEGFRLTLKANNDGDMSLMGSSPCVWPQGTPEPAE